MHYEPIIDRLWKAEEADKGLRLSHIEVADLVEEIEEMRLQLEMELNMAHKVIHTLSGIPSEAVN